MTKWMTLLAAALLAWTPRGEACTRVVYLGPAGLVLTGRTMDWREDTQTNLYLFPRGMERHGYDEEPTITWVSKYGSLIAAGYDIGTADGMNERGLVVNLLYLIESDYERKNDTRPAMGMSVWAQYVLDNFATVAEAITELEKDAFRIVAPRMPNGAASTMHMSISDAAGESAIIEYEKGELHIYSGRDCQVMTNSPFYDQQLAINDYWEKVNGAVMLPGTNRAADRFVRATYYVHHVTQSDDPALAVPTLYSVMRNVYVPYGIQIEGKPYIASTRWCSVCDQKNLVYYFDSTVYPQHFRIPMSELDFAPGAPVMKLTLTTGRGLTGDAAKAFVKSEPFVPLYRPIGQ